MTENLRQESRTANMGYTAMRGSLLRMTVLYTVEHLCFVLKFGSNNPALRVAPKPCTNWVEFVDERRPR